MASFLIQTINDQIKHDFCFHLAQAIEYQNWYSNGIISHVSYLDNDIKRPACIPVGSLEFVFEYVGYHYGHRKQQPIKPINIPKELFYFKYLKRNCWANVIKKKYQSGMFY